MLSVWTAQLRKKQGGQVASRKQVVAKVSPTPISVDRTGRLRVALLRFEGEKSAVGELMGEVFLVNPRAVLEELEVRSFQQTDSRITVDLTSRAKAAAKEVRCSVRLTLG